MTIQDVTAGRETAMRQLHEVSIEHVRADFEMDPSLVRVRRHPEIRAGIRGSLEPEIAWFIRQGRFHRAVLMAIRERPSIGNTDPTVHLIPFDIDITDTLSLDVLRASQWNNDVLKRKDSFPTRMRADIVLHVVKESGEGPSKAASLTVVPVMPDE
jgi:hypothetical protein